MEDTHLTGESPTDLPPRTVRALTEYMTVLPDTGRARGADDLFIVVSESGSEYLVDRRESRCDCPDARHNLTPEEQCKHERRVRYATGETALPEWVNTDGVDPDLGAHTGSSPIRAATDGGITGGEGEVPVGSTKDQRDDAARLIEADREECGCTDHSDFPCFECYLAGRKELPE
jgi:hypothetical protein